MDDPRYKLKCLLFCIWRGYGLRFWWREIWTRDLNQYMCCSGRECGCYGATGYDEISHYILGEDIVKR